ncbi:MAG: class I SAM-dependent RNA methyltransferase [Maritimibacter sp.]
MTTVTIERLGHEGDGIAPGPIFVPRALPGEVVEGDVDGGRMSEARIVTPSVDRVKASCRHYKSCGGCSLQHASDAFVASWKRDVVLSALSARSIETDVRSTLTSPENSRRRATFTGRRTKKGVLIGFHGKKSASIVEVPDCRLVDPALLASQSVLEALVMVGGSRKGELRMTVTRSEAGLDISVSGGKPLERDLEAELAQIAGQDGIARIAWNGEVIAMVNPPYQLFGRTAVVPSPGSFLQATKSGEEALLAAVREAVGGASRVLDLFAGCGTFSLPLAENASVHAVESEPDMLAALDKSWRKADRLHKVTTETRDLFRRPLLPDELKYDAIVIDPPRAGGELQTNEIAKSGAKKVAFVSCNPVTFARDAETLINSGFTLNWVRVVDQFRWSPHVELAASFTRD